VHAEVDARWVPLRNRGNDYLIDRQAQKHRTFTGIQGVSEQDAMIQDSQGLIADRTREHLGPTDAAIIEFRRLVLRGARELRAGLEPPAARDAAGYRVRGGSIVADRRLSFAEVMVKRFGDALGRVDGRAGGSGEVHGTPLRRDDSPVAGDPLASAGARATPHPPRGPRAAQ
jgi:hypothetical protein